MKVRYEKSEPSAVTGTVNFFKVEELPDGAAIPAGGVEVPAETPVTDWALLPMFGQAPAPKIKAPEIKAPSTDPNGGV